MKLIFSSVLLALLISCGEDKQETAAPEDTAECAIESVIITVCECDLTVSWDGATYEVSSVDVVTTSLTASGLQDALCDGALVQADITGTVSYEPEEGASEVTVAALATTAGINLWGIDGVLATVIIEPSAEETTSTITFE